MLNIKQQTSKTWCDVHRSDDDDDDDDDDADEFALLYTLRMRRELHRLQNYSNGGTTTSHQWSSEV